MVFAEGSKTLLNNKQMGIVMWHEYPIQASFEEQKDVIRKLRSWIEKLEAESLIVGYCFDHYFSNPPDPDELRIRFQYTDESNRTNVEQQLQNETRKLLPNYSLTEQPWGTDTNDRHVLQAYEFGSRCAFLAWKLIKNGRLQPQYFDDAANPNSVPFQFQWHFNHGVMNSLGIPKRPNEILIHVVALMEATKTKSKRDLINWLEQHLKTQPLLTSPK
jgi:hypothetical protein